MFCSSSDVITFFATFTDSTYSYLVDKYATYI